jgi:dipeptidase
VEYTHERAIATQQTGFSFVAQMRNNVSAPMKGVLWFGVDDANTCSYVPVYCCVTEAPKCYAHGNGDLLTLSWDAAFWVHNYVANQVYHRYSAMIPDVRRVQTEVEDYMASEVAATEKRVAAMSEAKQRRELTALTNRLAENSTKRFKELGDYLFVKYLDGNVKREDAPGKFSRTPEGVAVSPQWPGYDDKYYRSIVNDTDGRLRIIEPECNKK